MERVIRSLAHFILSLWGSTGMPWHAHRSLTLDSPLLTNQVTQQITAQSRHRERQPDIPATRLHHFVGERPR